MGIAGLDEQVAATAAEVDAGTADTRAALAWLGGQGLLGAGADTEATADPDAPLAAAVELVREVTAASLATGFSVWSQTMVLEYLRCCPTPVGTPLRDLLRTGEVTGATALGPALADLAGGEAVPLRARRDGDGWRLSGRIPWASNLFDDAVVVTPARTDDNGRIVVVLRLSAATVVPTGPLLALNGTGTGTVQLDEVAVPAGAVLSSDLASFVRLCLPAMLLTQSAMAVGLADAALASTGDALNGIGGALRSAHVELTNRDADVAGRLNALAANPRTGDRPGFARLRLDAMQLAADAVRLEGAVRLGAGFRADSPTSRRVREAAFLTVQAPTVGQLLGQAN